MITKFLVSLIPMIPFVYLKSKKSFQMLQQNLYNDDNRYIKWCMKNYKNIFLNINILFVLFIFLNFINNSNLTMILFVIYSVIISLVHLNKIKKDQVKLPLKVTSRIKRLYVTNFIIHVLPIIVIFLTFNENKIGVYYFIIGFILYLNNFIVLLDKIINKPIEKLVMRHFKKMAIKKLKGMSNMKVIGITGSYGKTSSKNILNDILNVRFNVLPTPKNYNTPSGLMLTINNYLDKFNDYLIAEMGAYKIGEVKELCDFVHPTYGILTTIGTAHLNTFGSRENIMKGKFELIESLPLDGVGILNGDDPYQIKYELKNKCKIVWIGIDNKAVDVRATNIKLSSIGTTFDVVFKGDKTKYKFETKLLGNANVYNILAGIALGRELGISISSLIVGVKKVKSVEHRLELKKAGNITIIDDAYNSNPVGSKMALDVLKLMNGKKIVVTPGMIEMGSEQDTINYNFGTLIASSCDEVILVGKKQTNAIYEGLKASKFDIKKIHVINDVKEAFSMISSLKGDEIYVLLENDLPDIFNEK